MIHYRGQGRVTNCRGVIGAISALLLATACTDIPEGVQPVTGFELDRYLGKWYEIARLDHSFERGLTRITAEYSLRDDGGVRVINRGYDAKSGAWEEAEGRAYFVKSPDVGQLKVSFFGPFYGGYNIIALDKSDYQYSLVSGPDRSYLWILARKPRLDASIVEDLVMQARELGFPVDDLIFVEHSGE
jgi:apolipoprotein D and lipocalin family protein